MDSDRKTKIICLIVLIIDLVLLYLFIKNGESLDFIKNNQTVGFIIFSILVAVIPPIAIALIYETSHFKEKYDDFLTDLLINKKISPEKTHRYTYNPIRMRNYLKQNYPGIIPDGDIDSLSQEEKDKINSEAQKIIDTFSEELIEEICTNGYYDN